MITVELAQPAEVTTLPLRRTQGFPQKSLASFAYARILEDGALRKSFEDEEKLKEFWTLDDGVRRKTWGHQYDLETAKSTADTLLSDFRAT